MRVRRAVCILGLVGLTVVLTMNWSHWMVSRQINAACRALEARDPDIALALLNEASAAEPSRSDLYFWMARAYRRQGHLDDVRRCLNKASRFGFSTDRVEREEWLAMAQVGQLKEAEPHLIELLINPGDDGPDICEAYVNGCFATHRFPQALKILEVWQKDFPRDPQPYLFHAILNKMSMAHSRVVENYQKAYDLAPNRFDIRLKLGLALMELNNTQEAIPHFDWLLKKRPENPDVKTGWGRLLVQLGKNDMAREALEAVQRSHPEHVESLIALGQLELAENNLDRAIQLLQKGTQHERHNSEVRYALANALQQAGRSREAREQYEFVTNAHAAQQKLQRLRNQVMLDSNDLEARFQIAELLRDYGTPAERLGWLRSIIQINARYRPAYTALVECYEALGQNKEAQKHQQLADLLSEINEPYPETR
ncbi:MAG: tetratricopeptide repeat protein [Planctomycetia bacterium]|nr:tetratricopeptide repeat protein [Planctomycetia bacterium]